MNDSLGHAAGDDLIRRVTAVSRPVPLGTLIVKSGGRWVHDSFAPGEDGAPFGAGAADASAASAWSAGRAASATKKSSGTATGAAAVRAAPARDAARLAVEVAKAVPRPA